MSTAIPFTRKPNNVNRGNEWDRASNSNEVGVHALSPLTDTVIHKSERSSLKESRSAIGDATIQQALPQHQPQQNQYNMPPQQHYNNQQYNQHPFGSPAQQYHNHNHVHNNTSIHAPGFTNTDSSIFPYSHSPPPHLLGFVSPSNKYDEFLKSISPFHATTNTHSSHRIAPFPSASSLPGSDSFAYQHFGGGDDDPGSLAELMHTFHLGPAESPMDSPRNTSPNHDVREEDDVLNFLGAWEENDAASHSAIPNGAGHGYSVFSGMQANGSNGATNLQGVGPISPSTQQAQQQDGNAFFTYEHGQHPFGEYPSPTLFVRNINSNVEDEELRSLFEAFGPIKSVYTQCKHRGFVMISYYDIRHAQAAMRHLQGKIVRRRKLDIHYSIPKQPYGQSPTSSTTQVGGQGAVGTFGSPSQHTLSPASTRPGRSSSLVSSGSTRAANPPQFTNSPVLAPVAWPLTAPSSPTAARRERGHSISTSHPSGFSPSTNPQMGIPPHTPSFNVGATMVPTIAVSNLPPSSGEGTPTSLSPKISPSFSTKAEHEKGSRHRHRPIAQEDKSKYELDIARVSLGHDPRTTLMIKNIPNKYSQKLLLSAVDEHHKGTYDFFYLPIDFKNKCNVGYAFINFINPKWIPPFFEEFNSKKWEKFNSEKVCVISYARIQGKYALISHFQNSSLMCEDKKCRPIIFHSEGPNVGEVEPFPVGPNLRMRRTQGTATTNNGSNGGKGRSGSTDQGQSAIVGGELQPLTE